MLMVDDFNFREYNDELLHAKRIPDQPKQDSLSNHEDTSV